jgi:hypothetical protein
MLSNDLIVGARAAAAFSGLTERQIYHMAEAGTLPCFKRGKRLFFRKTELEAAFRSEPVNG